MHTWPRWRYPDGAKPRHGPNVLHNAQRGAQRSVSNPGSWLRAMATVGRLQGSSSSGSLGSPPTCLPRLLHASSLCRHRLIHVRSPVLSSQASGYRSRTIAVRAMANVVEKEIAAGRTRIGWIGTGVMGQAMCGHILDAGFSVTVFNRTASKTEGLCKKGAVVADSPSAVAENSDVVVTIVGYPADVREVILGEKGVLKGLRPGGIVVDMTTSEPSLAREIFAVAQEKGCDALDAPVSGGDKGAKAGTLAIMAGGQQDTMSMLAPLLKCMGSVTYMGPAGSGQSCKLANQVTIASTMVGLVEGMLYAHKAGLDVTKYLQAIAGGAAGSKSLELYAGRIQNRDFAPGFYVNHFVKDLGIALEECKQMGLALPGLALAQQLYVSLKAHDDGNLGTQSLVKALERLNNLTLPQASK